MKIHPADQRTQGKLLLKVDWDYRYDEARLAYSRSCKPYMAARILEDLCTTATKQQNFKDAAYLCYQMAHVVLQVLGYYLQLHCYSESFCWQYTVWIDSSETLIQSSATLTTTSATSVKGFRLFAFLQAIQRPRDKLNQADQKRLDMFVDLYATAELYYAYNIIHRTVCDPFSSTAPRVVHNAACYLYTQLADRASPPDGICFSHVLYILAQAASAQGNWKLARSVHLKLQSLKVRSSFSVVTLSALC